MDAEILKDPVKQNEVMEKTNYASHDLAARRQRHKRRWDKGEHAEIVEVVRYTADEESDGRFKEENDRRRFELTSAYYVVVVGDSQLANCHICRAVPRRTGVRVR